MILKSVRTSVWISFAMAVLELLGRFVEDGDSTAGTAVTSSGDSK
jgi:hypothetical protein